MNYAYEEIANGCLQFMDRLPASRYIMSIIVFSYQHCDEQQFQTLSCAGCTIFSVIKLDLVIRALLLDYIFALEKKPYASRAFCFYIEINIFLTILRQNIQQKVLVFHSVLL